MSHYRSPQEMVQDELSKWNEIKNIIESEEMDEQCLLDTLEGETEMYELLLAIEEMISEKEGEADYIKKRIEQFSIREKRIRSTIKTLKNVMLSAMDKAEIKTIKGPLATITMKSTARKLLIEDESEIPADYWIKQDPKLDKKKLLSDLKDKVLVQGANLDNGGISLQIRRT